MQEKLNLKKGDWVTLGSSKGYKYEVAEIVDYPHGPLVGIFDEPPSGHIDYWNISTVTPCDPPEKGCESSDTPRTNKAYADALIASDDGDQLPILTAMLKHAKALERDNVAMRRVLAACVEEMNHSVTTGEPISNNRREFEMAAPFLPKAG